MTNKFFLGLIIFFSFCFSQSLLGKDLDINAKTIEVEKSNQKISADGGVEVTDDENNTISAEKIKYDMIKQVLNTFGKTEILTSEKFKIKRENIVYDNN